MKHTEREFWTTAVPGPAFRRPSLFRLFQHVARLPVRLFLIARRYPLASGPLTIIRYAHFSVDRAILPTGRIYLYIYIFHVFIFFIFYISILFLLSIGHSCDIYRVT